METAKNPEIVEKESIRRNASFFGDEYKIDGLRSMEIVGFLR